MWPHRRQPTRLPRPWDSPGKNTGVGCHFLLQCMKVKVKSLSRVWPSVTPWTAAFQAPPSMGFSGQEYWSGVPLPSLNFMLTSHYFRNSSEFGSFCFCHVIICEPITIAKRRQMLWLIKPELQPHCRKGGELGLCNPTKKIMKVYKSKNKNKGMEAS